METKEKNFDMEQIKIAALKPKRMYMWRDYILKLNELNGILAYIEHHRFSDKRFKKFLSETRERLTPFIDIEEDFYFADFDEDVK